MSSLTFVFCVEQVKKLFEDLRKGYVWLIRQTGWIAAHTRSFLIDKANSLQPFIAYEPWIKDAGRVNGYYNDVSWQLINLLYKIKMKDCEKKIFYLCETLS